MQVNYTDFRLLIPLCPPFTFGHQLMNFNFINKGFINISTMLHLVKKRVYSDLQCWCQVGGDPGAKHCATSLPGVPSEVLPLLRVQGQPHWVSP